MQNSSILCLEQELHHRSIAANTTLQNVRAIALAAANAWACQSLEAKRREARASTAPGEGKPAMASEAPHA